MKKIFLDANVLIDFIDIDREKHEEAMNFIKENINNYFYTSCDIVTTIYYVVNKKRNPLKDIKNLLKLVDVIPFSNKEVFEAINLMEMSQLFKDLEDTLQYVLAKKIKADYIVTNDKDFYSPDIEIVGL